nr:VOC family protein [uncultured Clostridium sp.]
MDFNKIHHVAIICSDYEISKEFYVEKLGFEIIREIYREERQSYKLDLKIGESQIELFSFPNSPKRPSYPEACGLRHLAFEVDDIEEAVKELKGKNIQVEEVRIDEYTEKKFTFFNDPDGLPLELYEK